MLEVLEQALEALEIYWGKAEHRRTREDERQAESAITSLRKAIQEEALRNVQRIGQEIEQEPVCEWCDGTRMVDSGGTQPWGEAINIPCRCQHTHPPQRTWVGLTDDEQQQAYEQWQNDGWGVFYNAIEAKLKEKNS